MEPRKVSAALTGILSQSYTLLEEIRLCILPLKTTESIDAYTSLDNVLSSRMKFPRLRRVVFLYVGININFNPNEVAYEAVFPLSNARGIVREAHLSELWRSELRLRY